MNIDTLSQKKGRGYDSIEDSMDATINGALKGLDVP